MTRGALLGFGEEAEGTYAPALLSAGCRIKTEAIACCGREEAARAAKLFPSARLYSGPRELLEAEKELSLALVTVPAAARRDTLAAALKAGLHAAAHPPLAASPRDISELSRLAGSRGLHVRELRPWERSLPWSSLSRAVSDGVCGELRAADISLTATHPAGAGKDRGVTAALGWQAFALLLDLVRLTPYAVSAKLGSGPEYDPEAVENEALLTVHFPGLTATARLSAGARARRFSASVSGTRGELRLYGARLEMDLAGRPQKELVFAESLHDGLARPGWMAAELAAFTEGLEGKAPPEAGLASAKTCARLMHNAAYSAAVRSAAVPL